MALTSLAVMLLCVMKLQVVAQPTAEYCNCKADEGLAVSGEEMLKHVLVMTAKQDSQSEELQQLKTAHSEEIQQLKSEVTNLTNKLALQSDAAVAFSVRLSANKVYQDIQTIKFDLVLLNLGGHYSPITGVFICPTTGTYLFSTMILTFIDKRAVVKLMKHDGATEKELARGFGDDVGYQTGGNVVLTECKKGEYVYAKTNNAGASLHHTYSTFSGFKIAAQD